jgi:hypothetical protein
MLTEEIKIDASVHGNFETRKFAVKESPKAFHVLSSSLYKNPIRAVIRELCCNAKDSHFTAQNPELYEVHLPTHYEPFFSVKDNGIGLSHEDMFNVFCVYFCSTKENTNELIGNFGLGAKSFFALNASATIVSRFEGKKRSYSAFKNDENCPELSLLTCEDTEEPNGLEITVPTNRFYEFEQEATHVFKYLGVPKVNKRFVYEKPEIDNEHFSYERGNKSRAVMGGIAYPLNSEDYPEVKDLLKEGITLKFDIGELAVTPSRENLAEDRRTKAAIIAKCQKAMELLPGIGQSTIDGCNTYFEARAKQETATGFQRLILGSVKEYQGRSLDEIISDGSNPLYITFMYKDGSKYRTKTQRPIYNFNTKYFIKDAPYVMRFKKLLDDERYIAAITPQEAKLIGVDAKLVSSLPSTKTYTKPHKVFSYDFGGRLKREKWHKDTISEDDFVFVKLCRYEVVGGDNEFESIYRYLKNKIKMPKIYGLREDVEDGIDFFQWAKSQVNPPVIARTLSHESDKYQIWRLIDPKFNGEHPRITSTDRYIYTLLGYSVIEDDSLEKLKAEYLQKFPMLKFISNDDIDQVECIKEYVCSHTSNQ